MEWISVKERLPEKYDVVLIYAIHSYLPPHGEWDGKIMCAARFDGDNSWACEGAGGYECENEFGEVTHWQPLPAPPAACNKAVKCQ